MCLFTNKAHETHRTNSSNLTHSTFDPYPDNAVSIKYKDQMIQKLTQSLILAPSRLRAPPDFAYMTYVYFRTLLGLC